MRHGARALAACGMLMAGLAVPTAAQDSATLVGIVAHVGGAPLADVLVFWTDGTASSVTTGQDGAFRLSGVPPGSHLLRFRKAGFAPQSLRVTVSDGAVRDVGVVTLAIGAEPTATVTGSVTDSRTGQPVAGAEVFLNAGQPVLTDERGDFLFDDVPIAWGTNKLLVRRLAYADATTDFWVGDAGQAPHVPVALEPAPVALQGVVVEGTLPGLPRGFHERRISTNGYFLDAGEIEARNPTGLTNLLRTVPGVRIRPSIEGMEITFTRRTRSLSATAGDALALPSACRSPLIYVDGVLVEGDTGEHAALDELVSPEDVAGIEAYNGASRIPTVFNAMGSGCGVIAIWTVHGQFAQTPAAAPPANAVTRSSTGRKLLLGAILVPAAIFVFKTAVCSLPHYCE